MSDTKAPVTVATGLIAGEPMAGGRRTAVKRQRVRDSRALGTRSGDPRCAARNLFATAIFRSKSRRDVSFSSHHGAPHEHA